MKVSLSRVTMQCLDFNKILHTFAVSNDSGFFESDVYWYKGKCQVLNLLYLVPNVVLGFSSLCKCYFEWVKFSMERLEESSVKVKPWNANIWTSETWTAFYSIDDKDIENVVLCLLPLKIVKYLTKLKTNQQTRSSKDECSTDDQTMILGLGLQTFLDHRSSKTIDQMFFMTYRVVFLTGPPKFQC